LISLDFQESDNAVVADKLSVLAGTYRPVMSDASLDPASEVSVLDQYGNLTKVKAAMEIPLTLKVGGQEIVTLMTLGTVPEKLVLGYLRNQRLVDTLEDIISIEVNWAAEVAHVALARGASVEELQKDTRHRIVTTGCGQGTIYSCSLDKLYEHRLPEVEVFQSQIYAALKQVASFNPVYRQTGSVHGCALFVDGQIYNFVEDVGRHNAMDAIAGEMWLNPVHGVDILFYTTGRLTSEIVMKSALMGIPVLVSRNGVTQLAIELAEDLGVMLVARAKSRHFQVFSCHDQLVLDAIPPVKDRTKN
jgi:FdhD protein